MKSNILTGMPEVVKKFFKDLKKYLYISEEKFGPELSKF